STGALASMGGPQQRARSGGPVRSRPVAFPHMDRARGTPPPDRAAIRVRCRGRRKRLRGPRRPRRRVDDPHRTGAFAFAARGSRRRPYPLPSILAADRVHAWIGLSALLLFDLMIPWSTPRPAATRAWLELSAENLTAPAPLWAA